MFKNIFTEYLKKIGWVEEEPMVFQSLEKKSNEIFFESSSQIQLYKNKKLLGGYYLTDLEDLIKALKDFESNF